MNSTCKSIPTLLALFCAQAVAAPLQNGNFETDSEPDGVPDNWTVEGAVILGEVSGNKIVRLAEDDDAQVPSGGLSRLYQDFDTAGATAISFEFQFVSGAATGKPHVPPDGFTAALLDPSQTPQTRVGLPACP